MSITRKTTTALNIDTMEKVAEELYYGVKRDSIVRGYYGEAMKDENGEDIVADLVISTHGDTYDIGIINNGDGSVNVVCDEHEGYVKKKLSEILPAYIEKELCGKFVINEQTIEKNKLKLKISR